MLLTVFDVACLLLLLKFHYFSFIFHESNSETENYWSVSCQTDDDLTNKTNDISFESRDIHFHQCHPIILAVDIHFHQYHPITLAVILAIISVSTDFIFYLNFYHSH